MPDDVTPPWKRNLRPPSAETRALASATRAAKASVKEALMNAFDKLGNEAFFIQLGRGSAEDKRCLAIILAKLLPLEIQGHMDHSLTVKIVTQVGHDEIVIDGGATANFKRPPKDMRTGERLEVVEDALTVKGNA